MTYTKEWTREEIQALATLARRKGISKGELARKWLGVHPSTMSCWMSTNEHYQQPSAMARKLLSCVEQGIGRLRDKPSMRNHFAR